MALELEARAVDIRPTSSISSSTRSRSASTTASYTPFKVKQISTTLDEYVYTPGRHKLIEGEVESGKCYHPRARPIWQIIVASSGDTNANAKSSAVQAQSRPHTCRVPEKIHRHVGVGR